MSSYSKLATTNTFTNTNTFSGDVILSKTQNNSTYATYSGLTSAYIGYITEIPTGAYVSTINSTQYQIGTITLSTPGIWTCNYEVELNCITAGSLTKIYIFVTDNNVSTTVPLGLPGAKANDYSLQVYAVGDSTYHSGSNYIFTIFNSKCICNSNKSNYQWRKLSKKRTN